METGRILVVRDEPLLDYLLEDSDTSSTLLYLNDATWFEETGGTAVIDDGDENQETFVYTAADWEAGTLETDTTALSATYSSGDEVAVHPRRRVRYADVELDDDDEGAVLQCRVPYAIQPLLKYGTRSADSTLLPETCLIDVVNDEWTLVDVLAALPAMNTDHAPAERIFRYRAGTLETDHVSIGLRGYRGTAYATRAVAATAPTSLAHLELRLAGNVVQTLAIPAGKKKSVRYTLSEAFTEEQAWKVKQTDPENMGTDFYVYVYVQLNEDE